MKSFNDIIQNNQTELATDIHYRSNNFEKYYPSIYHIKNVLGYKGNFIIFYTIHERITDVLIEG